MRSAAQTPISHKRIFRILPIFRTHFSHVISQITFRTFAFRISQITHSPWAEVYFGTKWRLHPSSRLATIDMNRKLGAVSFLDGAAINLTQRRLGRDLPPYQAAS